MNEFDPKNWMGKVLYVYMRESGSALQSGIPVCDARLQEIGGRTFLVGRAPDDPRDWISALPLMVSWEQVLHILVMDSLEDYFDRVDTAAFPIPVSKNKEDVH